MLLSPASDRSHASSPVDVAQQHDQDQGAERPEADQAGQADQAEQAEQADQAEQAEQGEQAEQAEQAEQGEQGEQGEQAAAQDGEAADAQGGGAAAAVVKSKRKAPRRVIWPKVVHGRLVGLKIEQTGKETVELARPTDDDRSEIVACLWKYADQQRLSAVALKAEAAKGRALQQLIRALVSEMDSPEGAAAAPEPGADGLPVRRGAAPEREAPEREAPEREAPEREAPEREAPAGRAMVVHDDGAAAVAARRRALANVPEHLRPVEVGVLGNGRAVDVAARWQQKPISEALRAEIAAKWFIEITEHTTDLSGRAFKPVGPMRASYCGSFPHAVCKPKLGPRREKETYLVGGSHDVCLRVSLKRRPHFENQAPAVSDEREILELLRARLPAEEVAAWGSFESSLVFYMELQFDRSVADSRAAVIVTNPTSAECAFSRSPDGGKLLLPAESRPYAGGYYEQQMHNGVVEFQFKTNVNVTTCNLRESFHARQFRFAVWTLNPYLNGLAVMRATTLPFSIKSTLHNDLKRSERWVESNGPGSEAIACPLDQIPSVAAPNRRKRRRNEMVRVARDAADNDGDDDDDARSVGDLENQ